MNYRPNPEELTRLEEIYQLTKDPKDWTSWAMARQQSGLILPPPPDSFCPGFSYMTPDEIEEILSKAIQSRNRALIQQEDPEISLEGVFRPDHGYYVGYIRDWPAENVKIELPHWTKTRFYLGQTRGPAPNFLFLPDKASIGGPIIYPEMFIYLRNLAPGRHRLLEENRNPDPQNRCYQWDKKIKYVIEHLLENQFDRILIEMTWHLMACDKCYPRFAVRVRKMAGKTVASPRCPNLKNLLISSSKSEKCSCPVCSQWRQVFITPSSFNPLTMIFGKDIKAKVEEEIPEETAEESSRSPRYSPRSYQPSNFQLDTEIAGLKFQLIDYLSESDLNYLSDFDIEADMGNAELKVMVFCDPELLKEPLRIFAQNNGFSRFFWSQEKGAFYLRRRLTR